MDNSKRQFRMAEKVGDVCTRNYHAQVRFKRWWGWTQWQWCSEIYVEAGGWNGTYQIIKNAAGWFCHFMDCADSIKRMEHGQSI